MKVCIIGHTERNYLPYIEKYVDFFREHNVACDVVCWQREERPRLIPEGDLNFYETEKEGAWNKSTAYLRFRKHVLKVLANGGYDKVLVMTTVPALFLRGYLKRHFAQKYLFDIRDYSHENFGPYRKMVEDIIQHSEITTISSQGFMDFLTPSDKIIMNHNINYWTPVETVPDLQQKQVVNIGFIGGVRYYDENSFLIDKLKNTFRYQLWYIGKPHVDCDLQSYCAQHEVTNVSFVGKFDNSQKPDLYRNIDIINSIYGSDSLEVTTALPNRLYEACLFKKPIISSRGTYLGEIIEQFGLGLALDVEADDVLAIVNDYVEHFDQEAFLDGCHRFLSLVSKDEEHLRNALEKFIAK